MGLGFISRETRVGQVYLFSVSLFTYKISSIYRRGLLRIFKKGKHIMHI